MTERPGGELSSRPLHFMWICDCSGSMNMDGKIQALNNHSRSYCFISSFINKDHAACYIVLFKAVKKDRL